MSSYPPKRQIFNHRAASESNSSIAGSFNDSQMATKDENSENSDGTDRASNHGNAASRPNNNNNNNNNQSYAMNLSPRLPVPTTVVAIETGMESSPSTIHTATPTNTT
eukprot:scaffold25117_cov146-Skeletonema_marinoi.AAC.1